jgi:hypothetical protein
MNASCSDRVQTRHACVPRQQSSPLNQGTAAGGESGALIRPLIPRRPLCAVAPAVAASFPCGVEVRIATLRCQRWRAAALARLLCTAFAALDAPLHAAAHAVRAPSQMLRSACRSVVLSASRAPPMAVRVRARVVGKQRRCLSWL